MRLQSMKECKRGDYMALLFSSVIRPGEIEVSCMYPSVYHKINGTITSGNTIEAKCDQITIHECGGAFNGNAHKT